MLRAVIFDMDGVIIDSEPIHFERENMLFRELGLSISDEEHHSFVGITGRDMWERIKRKYNLEQSVEELVRFDRSRLDHNFFYPDKIKSIPGIKDLIEELSNNKIKLVLASSAPLNRIGLILERLRLRQYFSEIVSGEEVEYGKPDPDIFFHAASLAGAKPEDCLVIEDSRNGIEAAKSAGMKCLGFKNPNSGNQDLSSADMVIESFLKINYEKLIRI